MSDFKMCETRERQRKLREDEIIEDVKGSLKLRIDGINYEIIGCNEIQNYDDYYCNIGCKIFYGEYVEEISIFCFNKDTWEDFIDRCVFEIIETDCLLKKYGKVLRDYYFLLKNCSTVMGEYNTEFSHKLLFKEDTLKKIPELIEEYDETIDKETILLMDRIDDLRSRRYKKGGVK